jgi:hypothetical protein
MALPEGFQVVSGGQTGVDLGALDAAIDLGIPYGGWCPRDGQNEDGPIPEVYGLRRHRGGRLARTKANVRDSDATLVLTWGKPTGGTAQTIKAAKADGKPFLVVDFLAENDPREVADWLTGQEVRTLNVAGPRASTVPVAYQVAREFVRAVLSLCRS